MEPTSPAQSLTVTRLIVNVQRTNLGAYAVVVSNSFRLAPQVLKPSLPLVWLLP